MSRHAVSLILLTVLSFLPACGSSSTDAERQSSAAPNLTRDPGKPSAAARRSDAPRIIFLGDSLTAGLGLDIKESFPSLIQQRLDASGFNYEVVNAGVSGDTSAGGLRRLEWALQDGHPKILIVALGGNDGLRGLPPAQLESNLASIISHAQKRGLTVIVAGMEAPPNFGSEYTTQFRDVYPTLAKRYNIKLIPFLLEGVAGNAAFNQPDGIHPNARGTHIVADLVWRTLEPELGQARATR